MRPWALALLALVLLSPAAAAQTPIEVPAGAYHAIALEARDGSTYTVTLSSAVPVDVLLVNGTDDAYVAGTGGQQHLIERLNVTAVDASGTFPSPGRWTLVVDNSANPAGGANGTSNATVLADVVIRHPVAEPTPGPDTSAGQGGSRDPWPVLMLTAPFWDLGILGLGGMALWFLLFGALLAWGYTAGWQRVGVLTAGVTALIAVWSLIPGRGPILQASFPLLVAGAVAWLAYKGTPDGRQAARMAFLAGGLGALLGTAIGHLLTAMWSDPGLMLLGAERFDDPVFIVSLVAGAGAFLLAAIAALVDSIEPEEEPAPAPSQGITTSFTIGCLRCGTPIKVDRSMKRYRVATDRYEFACPNCHAWMEWAEPKPEGSAAA